MGGLAPGLRRPLFRNCGRKSARRSSETCANVHRSNRARYATICRRRRPKALTGKNLQPQRSHDPQHYWLSTLAKDISFRRLIDIAKLRWRIERDYQELKQEFGLGHFEGRGWRGFHHHATLCIAYPTVTDPEAPPLRPERHIPNSIATMRRRLIGALVRTLSRCPCCNAPIAGPSRRRNS